MTPDGPLAGYADWPAHLASAPVASLPDAARQAVADVIGLRVSRPTGVRVEREWTADGVRGRELTWTLGFGPRTRGFLLEPAEHDGTLPAVLALHCHGGVRASGADQLVELPEPPRPSAARLRASVYDGRAFASDLARAGFAVLAHDAFSWASRAFDLSSPTPRLRAQIDAIDALWRERGEHPDDDARFDAIASLHEDSLAKAAGVLGTSLAGAVAGDDLAALEVLASWPGVDAARVGTAGLSGGGGRALLVRALDDRVRATVSACMMATGDSLVPGFVDTHSWLLHSPGLARVADLPALAGLGSPRALLAQYGLRDELFPEAGMRDADARLRAALGIRYTGAFHDAGHEWTALMQDEARNFLAAALAPA